MADDLLQGVQDGLDDIDPEMLPSMPGMGDFQMPSLEKMLDIIDTLDMTDEEKADLKASLSDKSGMLGNMARGMGAQAAAYNPWTTYLFFFAAVLIIVLILAFFGFKLYYSEAQKEKKRKKKKKLKQQKKKK